MNIFVLDKTARESAQSLCDKHLGKMLIESAQLLCQCFEPGEAPYRRTHFGHPCAIWVRRGKAHFDWLVEHGYAIFKEWTKISTVRHKSIDVIEWCEKNKHKLSFDPDNHEISHYVQCVPEQYKTADTGLESTINAYRNYYLNEKTFATWRPPRQRPQWTLGAFAYYANDLEVAT